MNWKGLANYVISALGLGLAAFFGAAFVGGIPDREALLSGVSAAIAAMIQHVRQNPFRGDA